VGQIFEELVFGFAQRVEYREGEIVGVGKLATMI
jgi:hypothetical protein